MSDYVSDGEIRELFGLPADQTDAEKRAAFEWFVTIWRGIRDAGASESEAAGIMAALVLAFRGTASGPS